MRCLESVKKPAAALMAAKKSTAALGAALFLFEAYAALAQGGGRPPYYSRRPVPVRHVAPPYYQRYFPPIGTYGSPSYALANRRMLIPAPYYGPYGYGSLTGYGYAVPYYGVPQVSYYLPPNPLAYELYTNPVLQGTMLENELRWGVGLPPSGPSARTRIRRRPSTPQQQAKGIHAQAQGDVALRRLKFLNAYERYKYAISEAHDRPEPYFRIGFALSAVSNFDSALKYIKQGLELDPQWPAHGERLDQIFGEDNRLAIVSLIERTTSWVRDDIRDPDRLFLLGVLLHFDGDHRASQFFEAAYRLAGQGEHLLAFLSPQPAAPPATPGPNNGLPGPPAPNEPTIPLEAIPGAALNGGGQQPGGLGPAPPGRARDGRPGFSEGPFGGLLPRSMPRDGFQRDPRRPGNYPRPNYLPPNTGPPNGAGTNRALPQRGDPNLNRPGTISPQNPTPVTPSTPTPNPATPALPLPPLPAAGDSSPSPQSRVEPPSNGPLLIPPSTGDRSTAQSP